MNFRYTYLKWLIETRYLNPIYLKYVESQSALAYLDPQGTAKIRPDKQEFRINHSK